MSVDLEVMVANWNAVHNDFMKKIFSNVFVFAIILFSPSIVFAQNQASVSISPDIPGAYKLSSVGPCGWIVDFYTFALVIAGILAFGAIVYGGVKYATSAGNASSQSEGRSWIWSALIGLLLLAGAYLILYTINPNLITCSLPTLSGVNIASSGGGGATTKSPTQSTQPTSGNCASGQCQQLSNCTTQTGANGGSTGAGAINCGAAQGMINTMNCIQQQDPGLQYKVTEGYPPAVAHMSAGHNNGCSIDVQVQGNNVCGAISALQAAAVACGDSKPLNEYASCNGTSYKTTTGNNVHINAIKGNGGC